MDTGSTRVWFPAIRAWIERVLGPWLPPHPSQVVLGAAMSALLASALWFTGVGVVRLGMATWAGMQSLSASIGQSVAELSAPPPAPEQTTSPPVAPQAVAPVTPPAPVTAPTAPVGAVPAAPFPGVSDPATVRETILPDALPYRESAESSLTDSVRQVDFALMQALARLGVDGSRLDVLHTEQLAGPAGQFTRQRLRLYLSTPENDTLLALHEAMQAWAENATLELYRDGRWQAAATVFAEDAATPAGASAENATETLAGKGERPAPSGPLARIRLPAAPAPAAKDTAGAPSGPISHELFVTPVGTVFVPPPPDGEPRLTVVIDDMGASPEALRALLDLDLPITVSIIPHLRHAAETARLAHQAGHEVLVHQPMEPMQTPYVNAGPDALKVGMTSQTLAAAMNAAMAKVPFATGLNNHMGSRLTRDAAASRVVAETAAAAGLFVLDSLTHSGSVLYAEAQKAHLMAFRRDLFLDDGVTSVRSVRNVLEQAERLARRTGRAIVIGHPRAETLAALKEWAHERDASVAVVPLRYQK